MLISAEIGLQHCGCLGTAFAFVDAVADAGVDCCKFQNHLGDTCNRFRPGTENYFVQDIDRQAYWNRTAFNINQWPKLADKCHKRGLKFACSVFSLQGVEMMSTIVDIWKVPSSKTNDLELIAAVIATGKPVVLSTGMSTSDEILRATDLFDVDGVVKPTILDCVSEYPSQPEHILLRPWPMSMYPWGLSDHSGKLWPGIVAAWDGAAMLEVHCCWHRSSWGPDVLSSLTVDDLRQLVEGVRFVERMRPNKFGDSRAAKDELAKELEPVRRVFRGT